MNHSEVDFFDNLASTWDSNEIRSTPERINSILSKLKISSGMHLLDLGTGTGVLLPYLSNIVGSEGSVTAIDFSEGMLSVAKEKFGNLTNIVFQKLDFESDQISGSYDIALLYSVYPHLHSPESTLKKLFKSNIKVGGRIIIAFPSDHNFINNIHRERKSESEYLPSAYSLADVIGKWGFSASVLSSTPDEYIIEVKNAHEN